MVVLVGEGDAALVGTDQPAVGDGDAVRVAGQIGEHRLRPRERGFGVGHPFGAALPFDEGRKSALVGQPFERAEDLEPPFGMGGGQQAQE